MKDNIIEIYDILIVGAGPAGMTAAIYAARAMAKIAIIEKEIPGGKLIKTSEIENYPGFNNIKGSDLAFKMFEQIKKLRVLYILDNVINIIKKEKYFKLYLFSKKKLFAKIIIIATGTLERKLDVVGEMKLIGKGVSYCAVCDGPLYKGNDVIVVGGGYSALEGAIYLSHFVNKVYLIHRNNKFRANNNFVNKAKLNPKINFIINSVILKIKDELINKVTTVIIKNNITNKIINLAVKAIFPYIGSTPVNYFAKNLGVLDKKGYFIVDNKCLTKIPMLYAVGDVTNTTLRQIVTAVSDGAKAAQFALEYLNFYS